MKKPKNQKATVKTMVPSEYLKKPYGRVVTPEMDGTFRAEIVEFPGCIATGDSMPEALANLEDVAASWLEATLARGQRVPEPTETVGFSGKFMLRLPKSLHRKAAHQAAREGVSLNSFIMECVAEQVGARLPRAPQQQQAFAGVFGAGLFMPIGIAAVTYPSVGDQWISAMSSPGNAINITTIRPLERTHARG